MNHRLARASAVAALGTAAAVCSLPSSADAADAAWRCTATPLSGTLLGQPLPTPVAGDPTGACKTTSTTPTLQLPGALQNLLRVDLLNGVTAANDTGAYAAAGLTNISVGSLPIPLPELPIPAQLTNIDVSVPSLLGLPGLSVVKVDLTPAIRALTQLPSQDLLNAQALYSSVSGTCTAGGKPALSGTSRVLGAKVLGLDVDSSRTVDSAVNLLDTTSIPLNSLDLSLAKVTLLGTTIDVNTGGVLAALKPVLAGLPPIAIPEQLARVKLTPSSSETINGVLVQRALRAEISLGGQSIADLAIGQAALSGSGVCAEETSGGPGARPGAAPSAPAAALQCTKRKLTLIDVVPQGDRVRLYGAADKSLAGKTVKIRFAATGKDVATTTVKPDGSFTTTAAMPARSIRNSNRARYVARSGKERSLNLKLARRMVVESVKAADGYVTIKGRVVKPLAAPAAAITLKRRVTCSKLETVKTFKPDANGRFEVRTASPEGLAATVYRLQTRVRKTTTNAKTFPTFTLPRAVDL